MLRVLKYSHRAVFSLGAYVEMSIEHIIGVTFSRKIEGWHKKAYLEAFEATGASIQELYPAQAELDLCHLSGLVLAGGGDIIPSLYGEANRNCQNMDEERDLLEQKLFHWAREKRVPVLGICRGIQALNVFMGGSLDQDLKAKKSAPLVPHNVTDIKYRHYRHAVQMKEGSRLAAAVGAGRICVNSHHHQAIKRLGSGLEVAGKTEDGVVEAVEARGEAIFGVQWHPELLGLEGQALFRWFYEICQKG